MRLVGTLLLLFASTRADELIEDETLESKRETKANETTTVETEAITTSSAETSSTTAGIGNAAILGCQWPGDFKVRYSFCLAKAGIKKEGELSDEDIKRGLLDRDILQNLMCSKDSLSACVKSVEEKKLKNFVAGWRKSETAYGEFQSCLQENTEAMNRLCGGDSEVGRVVSGAAGLQLNLIAAMNRVLDAGNVSAACEERLSQTVHQTAALYLSTEHFMDNAVLCWNVVNKDCPAHCSAFAAQLKCLKGACPNVDLGIFQELGIWQWYYLNAPRADAQCSLKADECKAIEEAGIGASAAALFDMKNIKAKMNEVRASLEATFQLPFAVLASIAVSAFLAFLATLTALCLWKYGFCGAKKRKLRYSRLDAGEESKSLTSLPEEMD